MNKLLTTISLSVLLGGFSMVSLDAKKHDKGTKVSQATSAQVKEVKPEDVLSVVQRTEHFVFLKNGSILNPPAHVTHTMSEGKSVKAHKKHVENAVKKLKKGSKTATLYTAVAPSGVPLAPKAPIYQKQQPMTSSIPQAPAGGPQAYAPQPYRQSTVPQAPAGGPQAYAPQPYRVQQPSGNYVYYPNQVPQAPAGGPQAYAPQPYRTQQPGGGYVYNQGGGIPSAQQIEGQLAPMHTPLQVGAHEVGGVVNDVIGDNQVKYAFGTAMGDYVGPTLNTVAPSLTMMLGGIGKQWIEGLGSGIGSGIGKGIGGAIS